MLWLGLFPPAPVLPRSKTRSQLLAVPKLATVNMVTPVTVLPRKPAGSAGSCTYWALLVKLKRLVLAL